MAVEGGRDIAPVVNELLSLPFTLKVATKDFHPKDHISFALNHRLPKNIPGVSEITISNPYNPEEREATLLWPVHCVQGTTGSNLVPELDIKKVDKIIQKGQDARFETYSAFYAPFKNPRIGDSGLADLLKRAEITHVYVVGLAMDFCVKFTAIDATKEGFHTYIVLEGTRAVEPSSLEQIKAELTEAGVDIVSATGQEVARVKSLASQ